MIYTLIEKKSRFIAEDHEVSTKEEVKEIVQRLKLEHRKASHVCYAYVISNSAGMSDDGEPSGTAGKPLFNLLNIKNRENTLVTVVRYYGGKKLGASGLIRAYVGAAKEVL